MSNETKEEQKVGITVGELIDLLQPYRGRGDTVIVTDGTRDDAQILRVYWDQDDKLVVIVARKAEGF